MAREEAFRVEAWRNLHQPVDPTCPVRSFRDFLTPEEREQYERLREKVGPGWLPEPNEPVSPQMPGVAGQVRSYVSPGSRGHHRISLSWGGEPNPGEGLTPTGATPTSPNPTHTEVTNFMNAILRRLQQEALRPRCSCPEPRNVIEVSPPGPNSIDRPTDQWGRAVGTTP